MTATNVAAEFTSTQKIPQHATEHKKLSKVTSGYIELNNLQMPTLILATIVIIACIL